jgi:hypothetical protein
VASDTHLPYAPVTNVFFCPGQVELHPHPGALLVNPEVVLKGKAPPSYASTFDAFSRAVHFAEQRPLRSPAALVCPEAWPAGLELDLLPSALGPALPLAGCVPARCLSVGCAVGPFVLWCALPAPCTLRCSCPQWV